MKCFFPNLLCEVVHTRTSSTVTEAFKLRVTGYFLLLFYKGTLFTDIPVLWSRDATFFLLICSAKEFTRALVAR